MNAYVFRGINPNVLQCQTHEYLEYLLVPNSRCPVSVLDTKSGDLSHAETRGVHRTHTPC